MEFQYGQILMSLTVICFIAVDCCLGKYCIKIIYRTDKYTVFPLSGDCTFCYTRQPPSTTKTTAILLITIKMCL